MKARPMMMGMALSFVATLAVAGDDSARGASGGEELEPSARVLDARALSQRAAHAAALGRRCASSSDAG
jgi:hypothetical protein